MSDVEEDMESKRVDVSVRADLGLRPAVQR